MENIEINAGGVIGAFIGIGIGIGVGLALFSLKELREGAARTLAAGDEHGVLARMKAWFQRQF